MGRTCGNVLEFMIMARQRERSCDHSPDGLDVSPHRRRFEADIAVAMAKARQAAEKDGGPHIPERKRVFSAQVFGSPVMSIVLGRGVVLAGTR
jgi:hypothetical protein